MIGLGIGNSITTKQPLGGAFSLDGLGLDLRVWYDFSTLTGAKDDPIGSVTNLGATGATHNLVQTEESMKPLLDDTAMAHNCLKFDDVDDHLLVSAAHQTSVEHTIAVVLKSDASGWNNTDAAVSGDTAGLNRFHIPSPNALQFRFNAGGTDNGFFNLNHNNTDNSTVNYTLGSSTVEVIVARKTANHDLHVYNKNGDKISFKDNADGKNDRGSEVGVIGIQLSSSNPFGGFIGEIGYFDGVVSEAKAIEIAQGLYAKWNI